MTGDAGEIADLAGVTRGQAQEYLDGEASPAVEGRVDAALVLFLAANATAPAPLESRADAIARARTRPKQRPAYGRGSTERLHATIDRILTEGIDLPLSDEQLEALERKRDLLASALKLNISVRSLARLLGLTGE